MTRSRRAIGLGAFALLALCLTGCTTHVAGTVTDGRDLPVRDAYFTVGLPTGVGTFGKYPVDQNGHFDFHIAATDESHLYLWNGQGDADVTMLHIDRGSINDHMDVKYEPGGIGLGR